MSEDVKKTGGQISERIYRESTLSVQSITKSWELM